MTDQPCPLRRDHLVSRFCEAIPSTLPALDTVLEKTMAAVKNAACAPEEEKLGEVELALHEALANAVLHGNQRDPNRKVVVACFCECGADAGLLLVVKDEGSGFDLGEIPDPTAAELVYSNHGRGIFLMRHLMDEVRHLAGGREVELRKHRPRYRASLRQENGKE